jgi:hypothetical protein
MENRFGFPGPSGMEMPVNIEGASEPFASISRITAYLTDLRRTNPEKFEGELPQTMRNEIAGLSDELLTKRLENGTKSYVIDSPKYYEFMVETFCRRDEKRRAEEK